MAYGKIVADQIQHSSEGTVGTQYVVNGSAKAWAAFHLNPSAGIDKALNISSVADDAAGKSDISFTNNFNDTDYAGTSMSIQVSAANAYASSLHYGSNKLTSTCEIWGAYSNAGLAGWTDWIDGGISINGDLA